MQTDGPEFLAQPIAENPAASERKLLAPIWHTVVFIIILLGNSYFTASTLPKVTAGGATAKQRIFEYAFTIGFEFILLLIVWLGIRSRGVKMKELIGGRWKSVEAFLLDIAIAFGFIPGTSMTVCILAFTNSRNTALQSGGRAFRYLERAMFFRLFRQR